jgi:flagellar biogenesis protein FliO
VLILVGGKRWLTGPSSPSKSGTVLRLVETLTLGSRCAIHLVRAGEHQLVVGVDATGVKSLIPLPASFDGTLAGIPARDLEAEEEFPAGAVSA